MQSRAKIWQATDAGRTAEELAQRLSPVSQSIAQVGKEIYSGHDAKTGIDTDGIEKNMELVQIMIAINPRGGWCWWWWWWWWLWWWW